MPAAAIICPSCHTAAKSGSKFCGECGYALPVEPVEAARPYLVNPAKLAILSVITMGVYDIYWAYRHWSYLKRARRLRVRPFWRAVFLPIFCYPLFKHLGQRRASWYTVTYIGLSLISFSTPNWTLYLSLMSFLPLYWTQQQINHQHGVAGTQGMKFGIRAIIGTVLGAGLWVFILLSTYGVV